MANQENPIKATIIGDSVVVWDFEQATKLYNMGFFGKPIGVSKAKPGEPVIHPLHLSYFDALYLLEHGKICIEADQGEIDKSQFEKLVKKHHKHFQDKYIVYKDLRKKGYIPRAGMKFGVDFVVYEKGPGIDHSPFMVHIEHDQHVIDPVHLLRAGRLATSVKKKFVTATVSKGIPKYYVFNRYKP